jgi:hypothetical protein
MKQRGRKSAAALAINVNAMPPPLPTPAGLNARERAAFERLVRSVDPKHLRPSDTAMVVALVQAELMSAKLARDPTRVGDWEKVTRTMLSIRTRLRLTPQSRLDKTTVGRTQPQGPMPWDDESESSPWSKKYDADDSKLQ